MALTIKPELQVLYGSKVVSSIANIEPVTLAPGGSGENRVRFFMDNPGINQVVFIARVINDTNSSVLGTIQETWNVRVLSVEAFQQVEQNKLSSLGVQVSIFVASSSLIFGVFGLFLSRSQLREIQKQNELTTHQMNLQLRPWIGLDTSTDSNHLPMTRIGFYGSGGTEVPDQAFDSNPATKLNEVFEGWKLWLRNHGNTPASNVQTRVRYFRGPSTPKMEDVMLEPPSLPSGLMMGEQLSVPIGVPAPWIKQENTSQGIFVSIKITYSFSDRCGRYDLITQYKDRNFVVAFTHFD